MDISEAIPDTPDAIEPREYRMMPVLVRVSWMGAVATIILMTGAWWNRSQIIDDYDFWHSPDEWKALAFLSLITIIPAFTNLFMVHRWRLRLDGQGLHRRRFFRWQSWPWELFRTGRIARGSSLDTFVNPAERWWRRKISVGMIGEEDGEYVLRVCLQFWTPPPLDLPETLTLKMPSIGFNRTVIAMGPTGIDVSGPGVVRSYAWNDVQQLQITRNEERHPGFQDLKLTLPDRDIHLRITRHNGGEARTWAGAEPEIISAFVKKYVPSPRTEEIVLWGKPVGAKDIDRAEEQLRLQYRQFLMFAFVIAGVAVATVLWTAFDAAKYFRSHPNSSFLDYLLFSEMIGLWLMILVYGAPVSIFQWFSFRNARRQLEEERARLAGESANQ